MTTFNTILLAFAVTSLTIGSAACSSDKTGDGSTTSSSGTSGTTSSGGTSGTTSSSGTTSTSSSGTSTKCQKVSLCINGACKCGSGPNKDKSCQKTDAAAADYCDVFCKFCT